MTKNKRQSGFTLVSVLIAVLILVLGVVTITQLSLASIRANEQSANRLQAVLLAKEGLEAVRNIRDTNWRQNYPWNYRGVAVGYGSNWTTDEVTENLMHPGFYTVEPARGPDGYSFVLTPLTTNRSDLSATAGYLKLITQDSTIFWGHQLLAGETELENHRPFYRWLEIDYVDNDGHSTTDWLTAPTLRVKAVVRWGQDRQVELTSLFTDWRKL